MTPRMVLGRAVVRRPVTVGPDRARQRVGPTRHLAPGMPGDRPDRPAAWSDLRQSPPDALPAILPRC